MTQLLKLHPTHPQARLIRNAAAILRDGGVLAYPTDSSYALGCRIGDSDAARRIRASTLVSARSARMRISTAAPNRQVKPSADSGNGHRSELSILDLEKLMLCP